MDDNNYKNRLASQIRQNIDEAVKVNTDYQYLIRNKIISRDWSDRMKQTKQTKGEIEEFKRQTKNLEYMAIPTMGKPYRLQGID